MVLASLQKKDITANTPRLAILLKLSKTIIEKVTLNNIKLSWILLSLRFFLFEDFACKILHGRVKKRPSGLNAPVTVYC